MCLTEYIEKFSKTWQVNYRVDSIINAPYAKAGDLIDEYAPVNPNRHQMVINTLGYYFFTVNQSKHENDSDRVI